jgi:hypothetical protein
MAARKNKIRHDEATRQKIRTSQLINRLQNLIFGRAKMTKSQVRAALRLLNKLVPDLRPVRVGDIGKPKSS